VAAFEGLKTFKMAAVAMVTKVQNMLSSLQTADPFENPSKAATHYGGYSYKV
jgi:hypothetical protein